MGSSLFTNASLRVSSCVRIPHATHSIHTSRVDQCVSPCPSIPLTQGHTVVVIRGSGRIGQESFDGNIRRKSRPYLT